MRALEVFAPFVGDDLDLNADLGKVGLDEFGHAPGVRVVGTLHRHRPDLHLQVLDAGFREHLLGCFRIVGIVHDRVVVRPHRRRDRVLGHLAGALEDRVHDRLLVDRHVERLADLRIVERRLRGVVGKVADIETFLLHDLQVRIGLQAVQVGRVRIGHDMAFTGLELLQCAPKRRA